MGGGERENGGKTHSWPGGSVWPALETDMRTHTHTHTHLPPSLMPESVEQQPQHMYILQ